jgi:Icc-related predicted phosphoesterase
LARLAAIGDLHLKTRIPPALQRELAELPGRVDALVIAGDITNGGRLVEAELAADLFRSLPLPIIAVLGNHDLRCLRRSAFRRILEGAGVTVLEGEAAVVETRRGARLGFAGASGCGGGFWPVEGPDAFHSRAFKALALRTRREASRLDAALTNLHSDLTVAVTHFAPSITTLGNEPLAKYWMLGNCELGRIIDRHAVDLVLHGHAHLGNAFGYTAGGTPIRNVASQVTGGVAVHDFGELGGLVARRMRPADWLMTGTAP